MLKNKKITIMAVLVVLSLLIFTATACAQGDTVSANTITAGGSGLVKVKPNMADATLTVITEDASAQGAQAKNTKLIESTITALQKVGLTKDDIATTGYHLNPKYIYEDKAAPRISGYEVRNEIKITIKNIDQVGNIIDLAVQSGANQVQNIQFYAQGTLEQKKEALRQATDDARVKAEVMAAALGKKIVGVKSATGNWYDTDPAPIFYNQMRSEKVQADQALGGTSVNPGQVEIRASSEVVYLIQ